MNITSNEIILESQRGRQWSQLITQQVRLRHANQVWCFNLKSEHMKTGSYYFTLHLTGMSSPFFTSDKVKGPHLKWQDLIFNKFPSLSAFVLRVWEHQSNKVDNDIILLTWGINLSGLVHIGYKITDIQPLFFKENTVIFHMIGGFFTSNLYIRDDMNKLPQSILQNMNTFNFPKNKSIFKRTVVKYTKSEIKKSYSVEKLRKLHYLEVMIKNKNLDVQEIVEKISALDVLLQKPEEVDIPLSIPTKTTSQLLTMNYLNSMLEVKPTRIQRQEMFKISQKIEQVKFKKKLLSQERERRVNIVGQRRKMFSSLVEKTSDKASTLMEYYHNLKKEKEKLIEYQKVVLQHRELLIHTNNQLQHRKRQLLQQLLWIYPIKQIADLKFTINGMFLPNSDVLSDINDDAISVALGYVTHILTMCSTFLQVPLRYPVNHYGSRSTIIDQISTNIPEREFPLFTKGKDKMQFTYGVYLLNRNIAQLRWLYFMHTSDLKLTLPNLLNFLQNYKELKQDRFILMKSSSNSQLGNSSENSLVDDYKAYRPLMNLPRLQSDACINCSFPMLDCLRHEKQRISRSSSPSSNSSSLNNTKREEKKRCEITGLSDILAIPEAFLSKQMSNDCFEKYSADSSRVCVTVEVHQHDNTSKFICDTKKNTNSSSVSSETVSYSHSESVEEGTDLLYPKTELNDVVVDKMNSKEDIENYVKFINQYDKHEATSGNVTSEETNVQQQEFMETWLKTGPALVCSDRNLYPDEFIGSTSSTVRNIESRLTARTDALLTTKSFNLVKPKH